MRVVLYTTYFANLRKLPDKIVPISICGKAPEWYYGLQYKNLAPKWSFFSEWKKSHDNDYYIRCFNEQVLNGLSAENVYSELISLSNSFDIALVCYERPNDFCHRHIVASWFLSNGIIAQEYSDKEGEKMPKYKIGITEAGDAGIDLSWVNKMDSVDGAILVTKCITPNFHDAAIRYKDKVIIHATLTGYGGSVVEPCVPQPYEEVDAILALVDNGFPKDKVVIRVDPIIPTAKGINVALNVIKDLIDNGFTRYRVSIIDMYPHVRDRFKAAKLPLPYGDNFSPSDTQINAVNDMIKAAIDYGESVGYERRTIRIESCAERGLTNSITSGCISVYDLSLLGLDIDDEDICSIGYQRKNCLCYAGKTELLEHKGQCPHKCIYCYWRTK